VDASSKWLRRIMSSIGYTIHRPSYHFAQKLAESEPARILALAAFISQSLHLVEHSAQLYQHMVLKLPPQLSSGLLFFLDLEWNHFIFNTLYFVLLACVFIILGVWPTWRGTRRGLLYYALIVGFYVQAYHVVEHSYRLYQFATIGCTPCTGIIGGFFNMVHLHFVLNLLAYVPICLIVVKGGAIRQYVAGGGHTEAESLFRLFSTPLLLTVIVSYAFYTGFGVDVYILGTLLFTAVGLTLFVVIREGRLWQHLSQAVSTALIIALTVDTSYVGAIFAVAAALIASQILLKGVRPRINHLALSLALVMLLSFPSLMVARWGSYGYYTLFTLMLVVSIVSAAIGRTLTGASSYLATWLPIHSLTQLFRLGAEFSEAPLIFLSSIFKSLTNPLILILAFYIVGLPGTLPTGRNGQLLYGVLAALSGLLLSLLLPVDVAALTGVMAVNMSYVVLALWLNKRD
jgi:hypothetical protein